MKKKKWLKDEKIRNHITTEFFFAFVTTYRVLLVNVLQHVVESNFGKVAFPSAVFSSFRRLIIDRNFAFPAAKRRSTFGPSSLDVISIPVSVCDVKNFKVLNVILRQRTRVRCSFAFIKSVRRSKAQKVLTGRGVGFVTGGFLLLGSVIDHFVAPLPHCTFRRKLQISSEVLLVESTIVVNTF